VRSPTPSQSRVGATLPGAAIRHSDVMTMVRRDGPSELRKMNCLPMYRFPRHEVAHRRCRELKDSVAGRISAETLLPAAHQTSRARPTPPDHVGPAGYQLRGAGHPRSTAVTSLLAYPGGSSAASDRPSAALISLIVPASGHRPIHAHSDIDSCWFRCHTGGSVPLRQYSRTQLAFRRPRPRGSWLDRRSAAALTGGLRPTRRRCTARRPLAGHHRPSSDALEGSTKDWPFPRR
jgi:hypothetical protein